MMSDIWFLVYAHVHHGCQNFATLTNILWLLLNPVSIIQGTEEYYTQLSS